MAAGGFTPSLDFGPDRITNFAGFGEARFVCALKAGRVGKTPVQSLHAAGENRTPFRAGFVANGDDVVEAFSRGDNIRHTPGFVPADVDVEFGHGLDDKGIEAARLDSRALGGELIAAKPVHEGFGHLAAGAVVDADKENLLFHESIAVTILVNH